MACSGEHIEGGGGFELIAVGAENQNIPCEGRGVAGNIHNLVGSHFANGAYRFLIHTLSRRIYDNGFGVNAL